MIDRLRPAIVMVAAIAILSRSGTALAAVEDVKKLRGVAIDRPLDADLLPADLPRTMPYIVRLIVDTAVNPVNDAATLQRLRQVVGDYRARGVPVLIAFGAMPDDDAQVESWQRFIRAAAEQGKGRVAGYQIGRVVAAAPDVNRYVYLLKLAAVQIRAIDPDAIVLQGSVPERGTEWEGRVLAAGAGAYVDGFALGAPGTADAAGFRTAVQGMLAIVQRGKPSATVVVGPIALTGTAEAAASHAIDQLLWSLGTGVTMTAFTGSTELLRASLAGAARSADLIASDVVPLDAASSSLTIRKHSANVTASTTHRLLYSLTSFDTFLVYWSATGPGGDTPLEIDVAVSNAPTPMIRDPITGTSQAPAAMQRLPANNLLRLTLPHADHPLIVDFNFGSSSALGTSVQVQRSALPRIEEIIFRHQQAQAAQDNVLQTYTAHVRMEQHFHPSPADPSYNIVTENRLYADHGVVEWEEFSFELNGAKWTSNRPPFPLVQPEKVLSLPLDLRLNQDYTYRLEGTDTVDGREAFVVRFDPLDARRALYRGTVWIDRRTFVRLKVQATETTQGGPVVSNDETQLFGEAGTIGDRHVFLLDHLISKQIFLIAGRSVLVEREVRLTDIALNPENFAQEREAARASNRIMYRDTDLGVRYLVKQGETRVVSDKLTTSARAFALGAVFDPSLDIPLPIGGLNLLDFNFLKKNAQLALLYGGVIGLGNIQKANLWGGRFDASVDFFGLAVKSNDDLFDAVGQREGERVNRIPVATGANIGFRLTPFQRLTGRYEFKYDWYSRDATTAADVVIPSSTGTHGEGGGYEYRRQGYSLLANATAYQRTTWTPWGRPADLSAFDEDDRTFTKYDVGLSKDFTFATFHTIHLNGTYFSGQRLDRFSMYQFGLFDPTRIHGVPQALRFADLGMFRGSYSFNLFEQYRLDLFLERAGGREAGDPTWRQVTGTGLRASLRTPRDTILQIDFGKSFLPSNYRGAGSMVLQVMLLKPL